MAWLAGNPAMFMRTISSYQLDYTVMLRATAADRGPSAPEERRQALEYLHEWQSNPHGPDSMGKFGWHLGCMSWFPI